MPIKIYVSHSIRGKFGAAAIEEQMIANCEKAIQFGKLLRLNFPQVKWYIPAEHEEFVQIAYQKGCLTETEILDIDCEILKTCNGLLVYMPDDYISHGMQMEISYAAKNNIPHVLIKEQQWNRIREFLEKING